MEGNDLERAVAALAIDHAVLSPEDAVRVIVTAREQNRDVAEVLLSTAGELPVLAAIGAELGMPVVDLYATASAYAPDGDLVAACDLAMLREHNALPLRGPNGQVAVAMANPRTDQDMVGYLTTALPEKPVLVLASATQIQQRLMSFSATSFDAVDFGEDVPAGTSGPLPATVADNPVVDWVDQTLARAAAEGASDVQFMFNANGSLLVRFREDGMWRPQPMPLRRREAEIVGTLLSKCDTIDVSDRKRPQDGTFAFAGPGGRAIDARLAMLPQAYGPTVVARILDPANINRKLETMGFSDAILAQMRRVVTSPQGSVFFIGPTGSGKAITLDTVIPTPDGSTTMGELQVGDSVLGRDGRPCRVTGLSEVIERPELYRVRLSDGQDILADRDHQWLVSTYQGRNVPRTRKRQAAVQRHRAAHADAERLALLARTVDAERHRTAGEIFAILTEHGLTGELGSVQGVRQALAVTDCPRRPGHRDSGRQRNAVVEYPARTAFASLAVRLTERFHTAPGQSASLSRMTTGEMLADGLRLGGGHANFAVPLAAALDLPAADLPVDPYLLGCWLGDGATDTDRISIGDDDLKFFLDQLSQIRPVESDDDPTTNVSLHTQLSGLGLRGHKHIPTRYLRASQPQRIALLQGLMDTDGTIDKSGSCELSLSDKWLASDALNLIRSLGIKASATWDVPFGYRDAEGALVTGKNRHRIHFTTSLPVFTLPRKTERLPRNVRESGRWLDITSIEAVPEQDPAYGPARCISVDSPDHTYLCGDGYAVTSNTTTLYGLLKELPALEKNILTAEDPIEYRLPNIGQTQIRGDLGEKSLTFAMTLRAMLRLSPDVILVGEVRDSETAEVSMHAALTGHMVLSTLHAKSAIGAYQRLEELGVEPYLASESLSMAVNQRLIRAVHDCGTYDAPTRGEIAFLSRGGLEVPDRVKHVNRNGCAGCKGSGYKGRMAVVEVLEPSEELRTMVAERRSLADIYTTARSGDGYTSILSDAFRHVVEGRTTVNELLRCLDSGGGAS